MSLLPGKYEQTIMTYHLIPTYHDGCYTRQTQRMTCIGRDVVKRETLYVIGRNVHFGAAIRENNM
jgi:hypothetical protein